MIKEITILSDGLKIAAQLYLPDKKRPPYPAVALCHGMPSGMVDPTDGGYPLLAGTISPEGFAVLTFRFRGCGTSEGNFDILGWTRDLKAVIDYLYKLPEIDKARISVIGFSAGAAVAVYLTAQDKRISAVAACACPANFDAIVSSDKPQNSITYFRKIGIIRDPDFPPSQDEWIKNFGRVNALRGVADIAPRPVLLIHAEEDPVVPLSSSRALLAKAGEPKQLIVLQGSDHQLRKNAQAVAALIRWLKNHSQN